MTDPLAIGVGLTGSTFFLGGPDAYAAEAEAVGKWYAWRESDWRAFVDLTGGWMQATRAVPKGGTEWNFSFSFGFGSEIDLSDDWSLLLGFTYHHISNALGHENVRNPSQNEGQFSLGAVYRY